MKKTVFPCLLLILSIHGFSQNDPIAKLYSNFEYCEIHGQVLTQSGQPMPDVRIVAYQAGKPSGSIHGNVGTMANSGDTTSMPKVAWTRTDDKGNYILKGVPTPGSYFLEVKGVSGYKKVQSPLRIDSGMGAIIKTDNTVLYLDRFIKISGKQKKLLRKMNDLALRGEMAKAGTIADDLISSGLESPDPYLVSGNCLIQKKEYQPALKQLEKAIDIGVTTPQAYFTAAQLTFSLKDADKTIAYLEDGAAMGLEKTVPYYDMLFRAYFLSGNKEAAKKTLGEMLETHGSFKNRDALLEQYKNL